MKIVIRKFVIRHTNVGLEYMKINWSKIVTYDEKFLSCLFSIMRCFNLIQHNRPGKRIMTAI